MHLAAPVLIFLWPIHDTSIHNSYVDTTMSATLRHTNIGSELQNKPSLQQSKLMSTDLLHWEPYMLQTESSQMQDMGFNRT